MINISIFKKKEIDREEWCLDYYYADLPFIEMAKRSAEENNIYKQEEIDELEKMETYELSKILSKKLKEYAERNATSVREILRKTLRAWLDDGLYASDFQPLCLSKRKETCNDADTKLPHNEIFAEWMKAKKKVSKTIRDLIDEGKLKVEKKTRNFFEISETLEILTGESLYAIGDQYDFARVSENRLTT